MCVCVCVRVFVGFVMVLSDACIIYIKNIYILLQCLCMICENPHGY